MSDLFEWFDYLSDDDTDSSGSVIGLAHTSAPSNAALAAQQAKFEEFLSRIRSGDVEDNAGAYREWIEGEITQAKQNCSKIVTG